MADTASVSVTPFSPVNFAFDDLKAKMNHFTIRFDKWTQNQRQRVLKERNEFAKNITESRGIQQPHYTLLT
jgi:kinetochore protein Spc25, fungi type